MIYSGHATMRHVSRLQYLPDVTMRIFDAVRLGYADLIFVYRHPLDSLLTNWVWWRTHIRENRMIDGISEVYKSIEPISVPIWSGIFGNSRLLPKATLIFSRP